MHSGYFHLIVNHFPIIGTIIGSLLLLAGIIFNKDDIKLSALGTLVFAAFMAIPAIATGNPAKEAVEAIEGISKHIIHTHEDIARVGLWAIIPLGIISAMAMYSIAKKERNNKYLVIAALLLSIVTSGVMAYVGYTGGKIRHTQIYQHNILPQEDSEENQD